MENKREVQLQIEVTPGSFQDYRLMRYSTVPDDAARWLWYPYIPFGMITVVQGYPGSGKSSVLLDIIARASRSDVLPDGSRLDEAISAVYQCVESGSQSNIKQMLKNSGADLSAVSFIEGSYLTVSDLRIQRAVMESGAKIIVIDPIQNFMEADMSSAQNVRRELASISSFAARTGCAVILVGHFTKKGSNEAQYQGMGSADIAAIARSILHVRRASEGSSLRYLRQVKCNIAPEGCDYAFELTDIGAVNWIGPCERDEMEELDMEARSWHTSKLDDAMVYLHNLLRGRRLGAIEAMTLMKEKGFSTATIRRAKQELGVQSVRLSDGRWVWQLNDYSD